MQVKLSLGTLKNLKTVFSGFLFEHVKKRKRRETVRKVDSVLNIRGFDLERTLKMDPEFLDTEGEHEHDASVTSLSITQPGNVDLESDYLSLRRKSSKFADIFASFTNISQGVDKHLQTIEQKS